MKLDTINAALTGIFGEVACNYDDDANEYKVAYYCFDLDGTFTGSVVAQISLDGTTFKPVAITNRLTDLPAASVTSAGTYLFNTEGAVMAQLSVTRSTGTLVIHPTTVVTS